MFFTTAFVGARGILHKASSLSKVVGLRNINNNGKSYNRVWVNFKP